MDSSVSQLGLKIARQVTPGEIHQAPLFLENFVKGGRIRKKLLQDGQGGSELGGFGIGDVTLLPWIFQAMAVAGPFLTGFLMAKTADNAGIILNEVRSVLRSRSPESPLHMPGGQSQESYLSRPEMPYPFISQQLRQCTESFSMTLQKAGVVPEESGNLAYKLVQVLWEDAPDALVLLRTITEKK